MSLLAAGVNELEACAPPLESQDGVLLFRILITSWGPVSACVRALVKLLKSSRPFFPKMILASPLKSCSMQSRHIRQFPLPSLDRLATAQRFETLVELLHQRLFCRSDSVNPFSSFRSQKSKYCNFGFLPILIRLRSNRCRERPS